MRLLLVEDDPLLGDGTRTGLAQAGYAVDWVKDGLSAQRALITDASSIELLILDLGLPELSGPELLQWARHVAKLTLPILVLTANDCVEARIKGLDGGADDYIVKPFDLDELCARIRALQRRAFSEHINLTLSYDDIVLDPSARSVTISDEPVNISRREFALLQKLLENQGRVLSRDQLSQTLYGWDDDVDSNALEVHVHNLRKKLNGGKFIKTIRGVGYMVKKPTH